MVDELNELEFADPNGRLDVPDFVRKKAAAAVAKFAPDKDEALLFMDMLGIIPPQPGNEVIPTLYRQTIPPLKLSSKRIDTDPKDEVEDGVFNQLLSKSKTKKRGVLLVSHLKDARTYMPGICDYCSVRQCEEEMFDQNCPCCKEHEGVIE